MRREMLRARGAHSELERTARLPRALAPGYRGYSWGLSGIWLRRPLVFVAICALAGDVIGLSGGIPLGAWALGALLAGLAALAEALARRPRVWLGLMCVLMLGGVLGASVATAPETPPEGEYYITGRVVGVYSEQDDRLTLDIDELSADGSRYKGKWRLTLYRPGRWEDGDFTPTAAPERPEGFEIGARVSLFASVYMPSGQRGEGGFDYRNYLMRRGVYACASGELAAARFEPTGELPAARALDNVRAWIDARLKAALGEHAPLVRGMMLGTSGQMPDELADSFRLAGFSHLLAVSGMHISFIAALASALAALLPGRLRAAVTGAVIAFYCAVAGFTPSVVRAGVMGMAALGARVMGLRYDGMSALALAAVAIVAIWPGAALDAGFTLSFMAVLAIYAYYPTLRRALPRPSARRTGPLAGLACAAANYALDSVALTASALMGVLPLSSAYFGQINALSILTSPLAVALGMWLMCLGWLTALMYGWSGPLGEAAAALTRLCAELTAGVAEWTASFDWGIIYMRALDAAWLCALVPLMLWASRFRPLARAWRPACMLAALALMAVLLMPPRAGEGLDYVLVDVGQGDAQLFTDGARAVVIDVGEEDSALTDYVRRRGLRVEALIITHLHDDHAGALEEFALVTRTRRVYLAEGAEAAADAGALEQLEELKRRGVEIERLSAGDELEPIEGLRMRVLHPAPGAEFEDQNDYSLVLKCEYAGRSVLLTGDLTTAGEDFSPGECDVIKVAHHGSAGSSSLQFLAEVNPRLALISASSHNSYGLPSAKTLSRLGHVGARVLSTADCGDITVHITPKGEMTARGFLPGGEED